LGELSEAGDESREEGGSELGVGAVGSVGIFELFEEGSASLGGMKDASNGTNLDIRHEATNKYIAVILQWTRDVPNCF
jgi:hypothetical protein